MNLTLKRINGSKNDTIGVLYRNGGFVGFTLEDEYRETKEPGKTRIPAGTYKITLRTVGGFHKRYAGKFPEMHKGMLWIRDVPGFEYILIHIGNSHGDSAGCILVGDTCAQNTDRDGYISQSTQAYKRIYPPIAEAIESGEDVLITVEDE